MDIGARNLREEFPIFAEHDLAYLDSAASTQKPSCVIQSISDFYQHNYSNVHRAVYKVGEQATSLFEGARTKVGLFIGAAESSEIVFTRGTTESVNLVAESWGRANLKAGDEVLVTLFEHHSNFVPWQVICQATGATLRVVYPDADHLFSWSNFEASFSPRTKLVAFTALSNALGVELPVERIVGYAKTRGVTTLLDAAQSISHQPLDVAALGVDFAVFSAHKIYGPSGVGVLYGRRGILEGMPPYQTGGGMISRVAVDGTLYNSIPFKFEAGTPNIEGAVGLGAAIDWVTGVGVSNLRRAELELYSYLYERLGDVPAIKILTPSTGASKLVSFVLGDIHPHDAAHFLDRFNIAVRGGHHCAQPLLTHLGCGASLRASIGAYNTKRDVDRLVDGLEEAVKFFG